MPEQVAFGGRILELQLGDITAIGVDAIVNAANSELEGGGGVDGAIHRVGGPVLMKELDEIRRRDGRCPAGYAVVTSAGKLPARFVFHAVGPIYRGGVQGEQSQLASCYKTCLRLAEEHELESISFPSISTGVYGYPVEEAAGIAVGAAVAHLQLSSSRVKRVVLVQFSAWDHRIYSEKVREKTKLFRAAGGGDSTSAV